MQFFTADYIYPSIGAPVKNGVLITDDLGRILELLPPGHENHGCGTDRAQRFDGILCPGFVNAHCHLELSYLKGKIPTHTGLFGFVKDMMAVRKYELDKEIYTLIEVAENEMLQNGIVAVGDISNHNFTFEQKAKRKLLYYTFIELFGLKPEAADATYEKGVALYEELQKLIPDAPSAITPHATYSLSIPLLKKIAEHCYLRDSVISVHNQESEGENEMYRSASGPMYDQMVRFGLDPATFKPMGFNSLPSFMVHLPNCNRFLLVHNTVSTDKDVQWAMDYAKQVYWCLCPKANLYIENKMPNVPMLRSKGAKVVLGTDSLASNDTLSILDEMKAIVAHYPETPTEELLQWGTINGAEVLGFKHRLGSFEKGKTPGVNHVTVNGQGNIFEGSVVKRVL